MITIGKVVSAEEWGYADVRASTLEFLGEVPREANVRFGRAEQVLGVSDRTP